MKTVSKNGYQSDDDNIRYKINKEYYNNNSEKATANLKENDVDSDDDSVRYKFPTVLSKPKPEIKPKPKIKVNFWSNKQTGSRLHNPEKDKSSRRHTVGVTDEATGPKPKASIVKVRKRVSFLPSPLFSDNHVPMVTVPDDLTIQLNEEEANDLREDLNLAFVNNASGAEENKSNERKSRSSLTQTSPRASKRKRSFDDDNSKGTENELEFFSKYVVQKLRRMETNQRIYSENLINTVLMLGQLGKLNGKSKVAEA